MEQHEPHLIPRVKSSAPDVNWHLEIFEDQEDSTQILALEILCNAVVNTFCKRPFYEHSMLSNCSVVSDKNNFQTLCCMLCQFWVTLKSVKEFKKQIKGSEQSISMKTFDFFGHFLSLCGIFRAKVIMFRLENGKI